jgi:FtsZ family, C-terminal domain
MPDYRI